MPRMPACSVWRTLLSVKLKLFMTQGHAVPGSGAAGGLPGLKGDVEAQCELKMGVSFQLSDK